MKPDTAPVRVIKWRNKKVIGINQQRKQKDKIYLFPLFFKKEIGDKRRKNKMKRIVNCELHLLKNQ